MLASYLKVAACELCWRYFYCAFGLTAGAQSGEKFSAVQWHGRRPVRCVCSKCSA